MNKNSHKHRFRVLVLVLLAGVFAPAQANYYLYQLPDGSRVITDRPRYEKEYKLVRQSRDMLNMGRHAASQASFNTAPAANYLRFENLIYSAARQYQVEPALIKAVIHTESYFNPNATSRKGASGLMQLMPQTAELYGVTDLYSPQQNIDAGVRHLRDLIERYPERIRWVLAAYNAGITAVERHQGIPPYRETQEYVVKVLRLQQFYSEWP
jgi:soluble lytic murein transglycosylase-like protein